MTERTIPTRAAAWLTVLLLGVGAGACGSDDEGGSDDGGGSEVAAEIEVDEDAQPYVDALVESGREETGLDDDVLTCTAGVVVDEIGVEALEDADIEADDLESLSDVADAIDGEDAAEAIVDRIADDCIELVDYFEQVIAGAPDNPLDDDELECMVGLLDDDLVRALLVSDLLDVEDEEVTTEFFGTMEEECPDALEALAGEAEVRFESVGEAITSE